MTALTDEQFARQSHGALADALTNWPLRPICAGAALTCAAFVAALAGGCALFIADGDWRAACHQGVVLICGGPFFWSAGRIALAATLGRRDRVAELLNQNRNPFQRGPGLAEPAAKP